MSKVRPNLAFYLSHADPVIEVTMLDIPNLEWAAVGKYVRCDEYWYEFIGEHDALILSGVAQLYMLDVGKSGKKSDANYSTQKLANNRYRLQFRTDQADLADLISIESKPVPRQEISRREVIDPITSGLHKASVIIERYPKQFRPQLFEGLLRSNGNGWQLIESFPWLAVRVFMFDDIRPRLMAKHGKKLRDIAAEANVPMCFKRILPKATHRHDELHEFLCRHPDLVSHHCPKEVRPQTSWLSIIAKALESGNEDFARWAAIHCC